MVMQEEINLIDGCLSMAHLSRTQHVQAQQAVMRVEKALTELDTLRQEKEKKKEKENV